MFSYYSCLTMSPHIVSDCKLSHPWTSTVLMKSNGSCTDRGLFMLLHFSIVNNDNPAHLHSHGATINLRASLTHRTWTVYLFKAISHIFWYFLFLCAGVVPAPFVCILITSPFLIYEPDSDHICVGLTTKLFSGGAALFLCPAITFIHALQNVFLWRKSYTYIMQHFVNVRLLFFRYPRCSSSKVYELIFLLCFVLCRLVLFPFKNMHHNL